MMLLSRQSVIPVLLSFSFSSVSLGAEWETGASLSASTYYTDNFCLTPSDKEGETVATVTPGVSISGEGARARMALDARAEFNNLDQSDIECPRGGLGGQFNNRRSFLPSGSFIGAVDALEGWLTLQANASASVGQVNPFTPGGDDAINGLQNTNVIYRWGVGGISERQFEQKVGYDLRYNYNEQTNTADEVFADSAEHRVNFTAGMLPGTSRFLFSTAGRYSEVEFDDTVQRVGFTNTLASAEAIATWVASSTLQFTGLVGEEFNEFLSVNDEIDGEYWDVGFRWTPNSRTTLDIGTGERFFGDTPRALINYRHKRSSFQASYVRTLVFPRNLRANNADANQVADAPEIVDLPGDPIAVDDSPVLIGDSPVLTETTSLTYSFRARRTNFSLSGRESLQTRASNLARGEFRNVSASATRALSSKYSMSLRLTWRESEGEGGGASLFGQPAEAYLGSLSVSRRLARRTSLALTYRYTDQQSDFAQNEFEENRLTVSLRHTFR